MLTTKVTEYPRLRQCQIAEPRYRGWLMRLSMLFTLWLCFAIAMLIAAMLIASLRRRHRRLVAQVTTPNGFDAASFTTPA